MKRGYRRLTLGFTLLLIGSVVFSSGAAVIAETTIEPQETGQLRKAPEETLPDAPRTYANTYETSAATSEEVDKDEEGHSQPAETGEEIQPPETPSTQEAEAAQADEQPIEKANEPPEEEKQEIQQQSLGTGDFTVVGGTLGQEYTYADHVLTFQSSGNFSVSGTTTDDRIVIAASGVVLTLNGVKIDVSANNRQAALRIDPNATATIDLVGENELKSGSNCAGLQNDNSTEDSLVITSGTGSIEGYAGSLVATGGNGGSGIGGGSGTVTISGGTIAATGGIFGSGIGGGFSGSGTVTIIGGTITATGGNGGSGIGGGQSGRGTVTINGGTVTAKGGTNSSGIGVGSYSSTSGKATITNGTVKALDRSGNPDSIEPRPVNDKDANVALCNLIPAQPNENVTIDGVDAKIAGPHEGDNKYYFYLTKDNHKVTVSSDNQEKTYFVRWDDNNNRFVLCDLVLDHVTDVTYSNNVLILGGDNQTYTVTMREGITETTVDRIKIIGQKVTVKLNNVKIDVSENNYQAALLIDSNATATIDLVGENELKSGLNCAGLQNYNVTEDSLVITSGTGSFEGYAGSLVATGGDYGSGIGGHTHWIGVVTLSGGAVTAIGGNKASGIGGGDNEKGIVTLSGGAVTAIGGDRGSGIGGGQSRSGMVTINGGTVTATSGTNATGIGDGANSSTSGKVTITNGTVKALDHSGNPDIIDPRPVNDKGVNVALCNLIPAQLNEKITIDGVEAKIAGPHEGDDKYYFYLTKETHKIIVDKSGQQNHYLVLWNEDEEKFYLWESDLVVDDFTDVTYSNNELILGGDNQTYTVTMREEITETTVDRIKVTGESVTVKLNGVKINVSANYGQAALRIDSNATATIDLVGENELKSGYSCAGLQNHNEAEDSLVIISGIGSFKGYVGSLVATGGMYGSGIGGGYYGSGTVTVNGGTVTATGGANGSGIGGGTFGSGTVTISGGTITATGVDGGSGIGGSVGNGTVTISGGTVTATGGANGSGIGGSVGNGTVTISGGTVTATGGASGSGIGGGSGGSGAVTVNGGAVTATGGASGSGIGGGSGGSGTVTLNGGTVTAIGGKAGPGIGGGSKESSTVTINGGTITAISGEDSSGIGTGGSTPGIVTITNGTVKALDHSGNPDSINPRPNNAAGEGLALYQADASAYVEGAPLKVGTTDRKIAGKHKDDDQFYFYLPEEKHVVTVGEKEAFIEWKDDRFAPAATYSLVIPATVTLSDEDKQGTVKLTNKFHGVPGYQKQVTARLSDTNEMSDDKLILKNQAAQGKQAHSLITYSAITLVSSLKEKETNVRFGVPTGIAENNPLQAGSYKGRLIFETTLTTEEVTP
ncbi:hypothetical protein [Enterococcus sp. DIV0756]|uniref:hypothetical protein n=1 Tax=Enterococcus sp. DIV0756 TaxID=2774636 RepID=UPI003F21F3B4